MTNREALISATIAVLAVALAVGSASVVGIIFDWLSQRPGHVDKLRLPHARTDGRAINDAPANSTVDERRIIPVFPKNAPEPLVIFTVFFSNGSATLSREQQSALHAFLVPLSQCQGLQITATGLASSARYAEDNELRNLKLVLDRVNAVQTFARTQGVSVTKAPPWPDLHTMAASRVMDDGDGSKRDLARESFNRQVSLRVNSLGACGFSK